MNIITRIRIFILSAKQEEALAELDRAKLMEQDAKRIQLRELEKLRAYGEKRFQLERCVQAKVLA